MYRITLSPKNQNRCKKYLYNFIYYRRLSQVKAEPPAKKIKTEATAKPVKCDMKTDKGTEKMPLTTAQR